MSFILDALRKSESERQRGAAPMLAHAPQTLGPRHRTPLWMWLVVGTLSVALVALGYAWLSRPPESAVAPALATATEAVLPEAVATPLVTIGTEATRDAAPAMPSGASLAATPSATESSGPTDEPGSTATRASADPAAPRPASELASFDPALPRYTLELLAFNAGDPSSGYAWINGRRYFPGERIGSGPVLTAIRADGVLLEHRGETFLLRQR